MIKNNLLNEKSVYPVNIADILHLFPTMEKLYTIMGIKTGEFRPPKKGEFFLSGAKPLCYLAYNDMTQAYNIMRLVRVKKVEFYQILNDVNNKDD